MFKNNYNTSRTQTVTRTNTFTGLPNILGNSNSTNSNSTNTENIREEDDNIMFAVITGNLNYLKRLVTRENANKIIDKKNGYTALHHAVRIKNNDNIIEYLLSIDANPSAKTTDNKDALDLTIESNYRFLIDKMMKNKDIELDAVYSKFDDINYKYKQVERENKTLVEENQYLKKSSEQYVTKIEELKSDNENLKRKFDKSEEAFANLLKKTKKN